MFSQSQLCLFMYGCRHCGCCRPTFHRLAAKYGEPQKQQRVCMCGCLLSARTSPLSLPLQKQCRLYSHSSTDRKCRSTGYDYQNGGSYFDGSHNASFVRCAPAFVCSTAGKLKKRRRGKTDSSTSLSANYPRSLRRSRVKTDKLVLRLSSEQTECLLPVFFFFFLEEGGSHFIQ